MIASAFGLICFLNTYTLPDYRIKVTEMVELAGVENDRYVLKPLFTYDVEHGILNQTEVGKGWVERMRGRLTKG
jgi:hypothetical protein